MKVYLSKSKSIYYNLALEEAMIKHDDLKEDILYIYQNENVVIVGRNQNVYAEIDSDFIKEKKINLARRISGGGAVYQDDGNVCFGFITKNTKKDSYREFLAPIIDFLKSLGLKAKFKGRNDVVVEDKGNDYKISGNAQYIYKDRIVHHGTLLFNADLTVLSKALKPNELKLKSKAIQSVRQRVSNIKPLLKNDMDVNQFIDALIKYFIKTNNAEMKLSDLVTKNALELEKRNKTKEWIYGKSPKFEYNTEYYFPQGGLVQIFMNVEKAKINDIKIYGDFLSKKNISHILEELKGTEYSKDAILKVLNKFNLSEYFGTITAEDLVNLILKGTTK